MESIRVFVVDDHPMIRQGLAAMMRTESDINWVGDAASGAEALEIAQAPLINRVDGGGLST